MFCIRRNSVTPTGDPNKYKSSSTYRYSRIGKTSISSVVPMGTLISVKLVYVSVMICTCYGLMSILDMYLYKSDMFRLIVPMGTFV